MRRDKEPSGELGSFLPGDGRNRLVSWSMRALAVVCAVAVGIGGVQVVSQHEQRSVVPDTAVASAQGLADAVVSAFADSAVGTDPALSAEQRSAGLPTRPVAGLTSQTPAGPVQLVLPGGLGDAVPTTGGQVVYPDRGAGFDFLAENTGTGTRTVSRIAGPNGVRMVTTFVRTPADTVMLAHTNGYLTVNRATPKAETVGVFSPAETRDAAGKLVPSSYVVRQLAPQLYQLSEVIDPRPDTQWPVYVDPPLNLVAAGGAPLPAGLFESISGAVSAVGDAVATAASATVTGVQAVGTFVKENPLESAMLVGGVALALTGVGGPASVAMITAATVNIASAGVDIAAAAMPDNEALGFASTALGIASMATPQGAAKQVVEEGLEQGMALALKHADDIVDVAKAVPTPPAQLAEQVAARAPAPPIPGAAAPKLPNAPPASPLGRGVPCAGQSFSPETAVLLADGTSRPIGQLGVGDRVWSTDPATGQSSAQSVQAVLVNHDTDLLDLTVTNSAGDQSLIHTTSGHPFYSPSRLGVATGLANNIGTGSDGPGWVDAEDLRPGDLLATADGSIAKVAASIAVTRAADMWDLTIERTHTFYVATPAADVLVHNCPMPADYGPKNLPACTKLDCGHSTDVPSVVYNESAVPGHYNHNLDAMESGRPGVLTRGNPADNNLRRRQATAQVPHPGSGNVKHEYPYASSAEGGRGAHVTAQPRSESDMEGRLLSSTYHDQRVRPGDRFTSTYRGSDGKTRCPDCANQRRYDSNGTYRQGANSDRTQTHKDRTQRKKNKQQRKQNHQNKKKKKKKKKSKQHHKKPKG